MTGAVVPLIATNVVLVVLGVVLGAALVRRARRRRARDLGVLAAVGVALGRSGGGDPPLDTDGIRTDSWVEALEVLRGHLGARRVVVWVRGEHGRTVLAGPALPAPDVADLASHVRSDRAVAAWTRHDAPEPVRAGMRRRDVTEIVVVPLRAGVRTLGALEVHGPVRASDGRSFRLPGRRGHRHGERALLATVGGQLAAVLEAARLQDRLRLDARHDPLTGLLNRSGFIEAAGRSGRGGIAVITFSLLDQVTDTLGHARGERFVTLAADRLAAVCADRRCPGPPVVARLEGDTFAVVVAEPDPGRAHRVAEWMHDRLVAPYVVEGLRFEAPVLVGVALDRAPDAPSAPPEAGRRLDGGGVAALLRRADVALAAARRGGPPVRCYEPSMGEQAARRLALIRGFPRAVTDRHLRVHYQPTVALSGRGGGTVLGVEALARWSHPELGELLPDEFVPVLEATGQITDLTRFVLDESLAACRSWLDAGLRLSVAVNVAVGNLADDGFPDEVAARLARHRVPPELLTLELTESGVSSEREAALPVLRRLHALGCHLAVDDFGTGQSSLAHLRRLPVDQVKIDKSFVLGMDTERGDVAVVRAIVELGHTLGLTVVAEGVEQAAVRAALVEMGCDVAQGYLVSRPLPAGRLERWLATLAVAPVDPGGEDSPLTLIA